MNRHDNFFKRLSGSPELLWRAFAGLLFFLLAVAILFDPSLTKGMEKNMRYGFAALLILYSLFRFGTFYMEYKRYKDE